ncbi:apolipoprotein N-acyltransferase [Aureimonas populi]|uniref:Apolipoprotein N-acyltransferase n=1 Tax=Aureimonas populi TaxID=1701758 RepID=A0ABW5CR61_9HYPH|nr:apolipoprotein N-acyltransferase [Aureimonas populi]
MQRIAGTIMLLDGWRRALVAFLAGALATLALAPYDFPFVGFLSFPLLVWLIDGAAGEPGRGFLRRLMPAFRIGWCFGFGYFVAGLWWLGAAILVDAEAFLWALPFAVLGLPAVLAIYHGLACALARALWSDGALRLLALAACLALFEYLRGILFTGFPWNEIGMMAASTPLLMQSLSLVGLHGLTLAAILVFSLPALLAGPAPLRGPVLALGLVLAAGHLGFGAWTMGREAPGFAQDVRLRIVQPNILQSQKWDAEEAERIFARHLELSAEGRGGEGGQTLVIWPESAFPFILTDSPAGVARLAETLQPGETLLAGAARVEETGTAQGRLYYNSLLVIDEDGTIADARDKRHLVPFGEYLPFQERLEALGIEQLTQLPGGFTPGTVSAPVEVAGTSFLPLICYEIIFQDEIALGDGARPAFLLNVTNDAWYGTTPGPYQHLAHAQASAVAFGLPLVRAANTGISVVTDARGRPVAGLGLGQGGTVAAALPLAGAPTLFSRAGNVPFIAMLGIFIIGAILPQLSRRFG